MATGETNDGFKWPAHTDVAHAALYMEYWYFNFTDLDTGKGGIIGFGVVNPGNVLGLGTAAVTGAVFDGKGGGSSFMDIVRIEDFSAHTERAEVRVGDSGRLDQPAADEVLVRATDPKGRIAIDLRFHEAFQPVLETVDARGKRPWEWNSWLIYMPSAKVTGTITVDGQTTTITNGGGYHDHSWGAWLLPASTWAWAVWSDPGNQHAGVIGYHCAFEESQAFVVLPDGNGGEYRIEFDESTMVFTPKATRRWRLLYEYPTEVQFTATDHPTNPTWRIDVTWTVTAMVPIWKSPAIIFEESCTFSGAIYRLVGGTWEEYLVLDEVLGHSESVDTWWGDAALGKKEPTPG